MYATQGSRISPHGAHRYFYFEGKYPPTLKDLLAVVAVLFDNMAEHVYDPSLFCVIKVKATTTKANFLSAIWNSAL